MFERAAKDVPPQPTGGFLGRWGWGAYEKQIKCALGRWGRTWCRMAARHDGCLARLSLAAPVLVACMRAMPARSGAQRAFTARDACVPLVCPSYAPPLPSRADVCIRTSVSQPRRWGWARRWR